MRTILDIGKAGAEHASGLHLPAAELNNPDLQARLQVIQRLGTVKIDAEVSDGTKKSVEVHPLLMKHAPVFDLVYGLAVHEPMVYTRTGERTVLGMLSPNFNADGAERLPSIKVIPLRQAMPLTAAMTPDARMATMLAGAVSAERKGQGGHTGVDFEHQANVLGAVSLGSPQVLHVQHAVRQQGGSLAAGLTGGNLGNIYSPTAEFPGYAEPLIIHKGDDATIYMPKSFVAEPDKAFGVYFDGAARIMYGAGLHALHARYGPSQANEQIRAYAGEL